MRLGTRELIFLALLLALPILAWWFYFKPRQQDLLQLESRISAKQRKLAVIDRSGSSAKRLHDEVARLKAAVAFLQNKLPTQVQLARLMQKVYTIEQKNNLNIISQHYLKAKASGGYTQQPIQMTLDGNFRGFYQFLRALEHLPRVTRIDTLGMRKDPSHNGLIDANFTLSVFFAKNHK